MQNSIQHILESMFKISHEYTLENSIPHYFRITYINILIVH